MAKVFKIEHVDDCTCSVDPDEVKDLLDAADADGWRLIWMFPHSGLNMIMIVWDKGV